MPSARRRSFNRMPTEQKNRYRNMYNRAIVNRVKMGTIVRYTKNTRRPDRQWLAFKMNNTRYVLDPNLYLFELRPRVRNIKNTRGAVIAAKLNRNSNSFRKLTNTNSYNQNEANGTINIKV